MGFRYAWVAIRGERPEALMAALDLTATEPSSPDLETCPPAAFSAIALESGWTAVVDGTLTRLLYPEAHRRLSAEFGTLVCLVVDDSTMVRAVSMWEGGTQRWEVSVSEGSAPALRGAVPDGLRARLRAGLDEATLIEVAREWVGLRIDAVAQPGGRRFRRLAPRMDLHLAHRAAQGTLREAIALDLVGSDVTDEGLAHLAGLDRLQSLSLSGRPITDRGVAALVGLRSLRALDLSNTRVTGAGLTSLGALPALRELCLGGLTLDEGAFGSILALPTLQSLTIDASALSGGAVERLGSARWTNLTFLDGAVGVQTLRVVAAMPELKRLGLVRVPLDAEALGAIAASDTIEVLYLWETPGAEEALSVLAPMPRLNRIFGSGPHLEGDALNAAIGRTPAVRRSAPARPAPVEVAPPAPAVPMRRVAWMVLVLLVCVAAIVRGC